MAGVLVVFAQQGSHGFAEEDIAVFISFPSADMDEHSSAINVRRFEHAEFGYSQTGSIGNAQNGLVLWGFNRSEEGEDFLHSEDLWEGLWVFWGEGGV